MIILYALILVVFPVLFIYLNFLLIRGIMKMVRGD